VRGGVLSRSIGRSSFFRVVIHAMGKYSMGDSQHLQTLSWFAVPCLRRGGRGSRADDDCPAERQRPLFFLQGCSVFFYGLPQNTCMVYLVHLCPSYSSSKQREGELLPQKGPMQLKIHSFLAPSHHSGPVLPNSFHLPMSLLTVAKPAADPTWARSTGTDWQGCQTWHSAGGPEPTKLPHF
jgi:hypothetical protein